MGRRLGNPRVTTSVTISPEFFELCRDNSISFSEAIRVGISLILAEKGIRDYDNSLNVTRRIVLLQEKLTKTMEELEDLKTKNGQ